MRRTATTTRPSRRARGLALFVIALAGCDEPLSSPPTPPHILEAQVAAGPYNVLSAVVHARVYDADSVVVQFGPAGDALASLTPVVRRPSGFVSIPVLGLHALTAYEFRILAHGPGGLVSSESLRLTTGPLPADLPAYSAGGPDPSEGFVVFAAYPFGIVIDNTGRVVWYRRLEQGPTLNFQAQPNGRYATSPVLPASGDTHPWTEFDPLGAPTRRLGCARGLVSRFHELRALPDGTWWILCDETRVMDLSAVGGLPNAVVTGSVVQRVARDGALLFEWSAFDHFALTDLDPSLRTGPVVNWTHANALTFDRNGNLLVSFRSLNEVTNIHAGNGAVLWRLGGRASWFNLTGTNEPFAGQHGVRSTAAGELVLLDNRGATAGTRVLRLVVDLIDLTATVTASVSAPPAVRGLVGGSTQVLPNGHVLAAYGNGNRVQEYDADGNVAWEIHGDPGYIFRAQRIRSLYQPGMDSPP